MRACSVHVRPCTFQPATRPVDPHCAADQMRLSKLTAWHNFWSHIYDFTPKVGIREMLQNGCCRSSLRRRQLPCEGQPRPTGTHCQACVFRDGPPVGVVTTSSDRAPRGGAGRQLGGSAHAQRCAGERVAVGCGGAAGPCATGGGGGAVPVGQRGRGRARQPGSPLLRNAVLLVRRQASCLGLRAPRQDEAAGAQVRDAR